MPDDAPVPFSSHLDELRKRLIWIVLGVFIAFSLVFGLWAEYLVNYLQGIAVVERPVQDAPSAINERPAGAIRVIGFGKPTGASFVADIALHVHDGGVADSNDEAATAALATDPPREVTVLSGLRNAGSEAALEDEGRVVFDLRAFDAATGRASVFHIAVPSSARAGRPRCTSPSASTTACASRSRC
jgi:hypothetical protein